MSLRRQPVSANPLKEGLHLGRRLSWKPRAGRERKGVSEPLPRLLGLAQIIRRHREQEISPQTLLIGQRWGGKNGSLQEPDGTRETVDLKGLNPLLVELHAFAIIGPALGGKRHKPERCDQHQGHLARAEGASSVDKGQDAATIDIQNSLPLTAKRWSNGLIVCRRQTKSKGSRRGHGCLRQRERWRDEP